MRRWVAFHGIALNVCPDLTPFRQIVPCGISGREVTSVSQLLAERGGVLAERGGMLACSILALCQQNSMIWHNADWSRLCLKGIACFLLSIFCSFYVA